MVVAGCLLTGAGAQNASQQAAVAKSAAGRGVNRTFSVRLKLPGENAKPPRVSAAGVVRPEASITVAFLT